MVMYQCLEFGPCSCYFNNKYFLNVYDAKIYAYRKTHTFISSRYIYGEGHCYDVIRLVGCKEKCIITYYHKNLNINLIQKWYKLHFKRKMDSIIFLQCALRKAIANPSTKLCQKRLLREFNGM